MIEYGPTPSFDERNSILNQYDQQELNFLRRKVIAGKKLTAEEEQRYDELGKKEEDGLGERKKETMKNPER